LRVHPRTFPTSLFRSVFVSTVSFSAEIPARDDDETDGRRERRWTTVVYSNFILGAFGILNGQRQPAPSFGASLSVQRLIAPAALVSRRHGIFRRDARKILARALMIGDKTRGNSTVSRFADETTSATRRAISRKDPYLRGLFEIMDKTYGVDVVSSGNYYWPNHYARPSLQIKRKIPISSDCTSKEVFYYEPSEGRNADTHLSC